MTATSTLAIDTSSAWCSVSIRNDATGAVHTLCDEAAGNHFEQLSAIVARAMSECSATYGDLKAVIAGTGPGSFTGLRIALSFAKGLAWSREISLTGISSFEGAAYAAALRVESDSFCVISDARRNEVFFQSYRRAGSKLSAVTDVKIVSMTDAVSTAVAEIGAVQSKIKFISTDRVSPLPVEVKEVLLLGNVSVGLLSASANATGGYSVAQLSFLQPHYVRAVAAETIAERQAKRMG